MRWPFVVLCLLLAACNAPGPGFHGVVPVRVAVGQSMFDVRIDGLWAQAIRLTPEWAPRPAAVIPRAVAAMEGVSGCRVARLGGDQAVMVAQLDCGAGAPPPAPPSFTCQVEKLGHGEADLICQPRR
ncbi:hypothetical protein RA2_02253 [Roseovarius sp. A-2]|uniref:hypothetical protein n=1 Tax=Roseovarius sp. A-2 TaxID=1570360 RepID=UPI0009B58EF6|nr:hypothetical protein [Roseovarius sp. A-2]GAW35193.1 hypothetical protein RA2_02253 [Roseovarius sp. A-2]